MDRAGRAESPPVRRAGFAFGGAKMKALGLVIDLVNQMEMSSLLALNVGERAICAFLVGLPVQRDPDRKVAPLIASNDLDATHGLAPG